MFLKKLIEIVKSRKNIEAIIAEKIEKDIEKEIEKDLKNKDSLVIKFRSYYTFEDEEIPVEQILKKIALKYTLKGNIVSVYKDEWDTCITFSFQR